MSEAKKTYVVLKKQIEDLKKEYMKAGKKAFGEESKTLFASHPKLKEFSWTQYTPYFNDGEPCTFSAHTYDPYLNGEDYWYEGEDQERTVMTKGEFESARKDVREFLEQFDDDTLEHLFGDHVKVVVTKRGAKIHEYSHD